MSESIDIPRRKGKQRLVVSSTASSPNMNTSDSPASATPASDSSPIAMQATSPSNKGKAAMQTGGFSLPRYGHERRTSLLSSSLSKSEHTVINIGDDEQPRLITCVKASQGFDWNQDIFLPSYLSDRYHQNDLERRQDPVEDIFITDEEAQGIFPQ